MNKNKREKKAKKSWGFCGIETLLYGMGKEAKMNKEKAILLKHFNHPIPTLSLENPCKVPQYKTNM